jgi:hypothetical protein
LIWIRIHGFVPLDDGYGSAPYPDPDHALFSSGFKDEKNSPNPALFSCGFKDERKI